MTTDPVRTIASTNMCGAPRSPGLADNLEPDRIAVGLAHNLEPHHLTDHHGPRRLALNLDDHFDPTVSPRNDGHLQGTAIKRWDH